MVSDLETFRRVYNEHAPADMDFLETSQGLAEDIHSRIRLDEGVLSRQMRITTLLRVNNRVTMLSMDFAAKLCIRVLLVDVRSLWPSNTHSYTK